MMTLATPQPLKCANLIGIIAQPPTTIVAKISGSLINLYFPISECSFMDDFKSLEAIKDNL